MNPEGIMLNEMPDSEREILYNLTYMWNLKKKKNQTHKASRLVVARGRAGGRGMDEGG